MLALDITQHNHLNQCTQYYKQTSAVNRYLTNWQILLLTSTSTQYHYKQTRWQHRDGDLDFSQNPR